MVITDDGAHRTTDMTEAAVLASQGFKYVLERLSSTQAAWVFDCPDERHEEFEDLIDLYRERSCKVEPKAFIQEVGRLRSELYRLLGKEPVRRAAAPSSQAV